MNSVPCFKDRDQPAQMQRGSIEWRATWATLETVTGSTAGWLYCGSDLRDGRWHHAFLHRALPGRGRTWLHLPASAKWAPEKGGVPCAA